VTGEEKIIGGYLVSKCINNHLPVVRCKAVGTLVVPKWPSAAYWPLLFKQNLEYVAYVRDVLEFFEVDRIFVSGYQGFQYF
jgi:hypothetical protein